MKERFLIIFCTVTVLLGAGLLSTLPVFSDETESFTLLFKKGNEAYQKGQYETALSNYERILTHGFASGKVYYNIGNTYFYLGNIGKAILYYERARRILPGDEDVKANLELAYSMTEDKIEAPQPGLMSRAFRFFYNKFNLNTLAAASLIIYLVISALVITGILIRITQIRKWCFRSAMICAIPLIVFGYSFLWKLYDLHYNPQAVVLADQVEAKSGPAENFTSLFTIHEGTKVNIIAGRSDWVRIDLPNGLNGWIPGDALERI